VPRVSKEKKELEDVVKEKEEQMLKLQTPPALLP